MINLQTYQWVVDTIARNRDNIEGLRQDFGEIYHENGYGSYFFHSPGNMIFGQFWVHVEQGRIVSFGFAGPSELRFSTFEAQFEALSRNYGHYDNLWYFHFKDAANNVAVTITGEKEHWQPDDFVTGFTVRFLEQKK